MSASSKFAARMLGIDPQYGSQAHQRQLCERLDECHKRAPCTVVGDDHEHSLKCYPENVVRAVCAGSTS